MTDEMAELKRRLVVGRKRDGRNRYDEQAKSELVALCLQPGASVSRLARDFGINANQVTRWLREHGHGARPRAAVARAAPTSPVFVAVPLAPPVNVHGAGGAGGAGGAAPAVQHLQARLPNGVSVDFRGVDAAQVSQLIEALGRLRCSVSTKG
jgi:transposase